MDLDSTSIAMRSGTEDNFRGSNPGPIVFPLHRRHRVTVPGPLIVLIPIMPFFTFSEIGGSVTPPGPIPGVLRGFGQWSSSGDAGDRGQGCG